MSHYGPGGSLNGWSKCTVLVNYLAKNQRVRPVYRWVLLVSIVTYIIAYSSESEETSLLFIYS